MKKIITIIILSLMFAFILTGCMSDEEKAEKEEKEKIATESIQNFMRETVRFAWRDFFPFAYT